MILLHLYEILEKATLMYSDRKQVSGVHDQDLGKGLLQRETMEFFVSNAPYLITSPEFMYFSYQFHLSYFDVFSFLLFKNFLSD